jgi:hypothetical protein
MGRLLKVAILAGIVALLTMAVPDIKRYLKMSSM